MFALITNTPTGYRKLLPYRIYVAYLSPLLPARGHETRKLLIMGTEEWNYQLASVEKCRIVMRKELVEIQNFGLQIG